MPYEDLEMDIISSLGYRLKLGEEECMGEE